jgi:hypothetical protein
MSELDPSQNGTTEVIFEEIDIEEYVLAKKPIPQAIIKFHSHRSDYRQFSSLDDESDELLFSSVSSLLGDGLPHASVILLPDGTCIGRAVKDGLAFEPLSSITVVGENIVIWNDMPGVSVPASGKRNQQVFGKGTIGLLQSLSAAVVGCSGTGSLVVEQLARRVTRDLLSFGTPGFLKGNGVRGTISDC